jgi:E3 ubiquitin-protein ligase DOA10
MYAIFFSTTALSSFVYVWLFPPVVKRAYANDTFTTLRLDE